MSFEPIAGKARDHRGFRARGRGYDLRLLRGEAVLALGDADRQTPELVRMTFVGATLPPLLEGLDRLPGNANYFIGNDPSNWKTDVPTFGKVRYADLYPGVDVVFYGNHRALEYDFVVAPGANPSRIRVKFAGARSMRLDRNGDLLLTTGRGEIRQHRPVVYQEQDSRRVLIPAKYILRRNGDVQFSIEEYDARRPLVIDPVLVYGSYLGGAGSDHGADVAVDATGAMYLTGVTGLTDVDVFIVKLDPTGTRAVYTAFLGGREAEDARGIAVDRAGHAYVTGRTGSADFPMVNALQPALAGGGADAFVAKVNADGTAVVYSTFLGGSWFEGALAIAVDATGSAYVAGHVNLPFPGVPPFPPDDFPLVNALQPDRRGPTDAFVAKVNPVGSALVYSTYLGGSSFDYVTAVAVDVHGQLHVLGDTGSADFPIASAFQGVYGGGVSDAFVTKLNAQGSAILYSSYLGGSDYDQTGGIALDAFGHALIAGVTWSSDFPVVNAIQPVHGGGIADAFVAKVGATGSTVHYATYLGGGVNDVATAIAADATGAAVVVGNTESPDFPTTAAVQATFGGNTDAFVTRLDAAGSSLVYSTFLGGDSYDSAQGVALDASDNAFALGTAGSSAFPVTPDALQPVHGGGDYDAFVVKIGALCPPDVTEALAFYALPVQAVPLTLLRFQWVFIGNPTTTPMAAPLAVALTHLQNGQFIGSRVTTQCASAESSPVQVIFAGGDQVLLPGEVTATLLIFLQTAAGEISYTPRLLRGLPVR